MVLALVMIVSMMLAAGLQVDRENLRNTLRQYGLLGRAFLANFVLVPFVAVLCVWLFHVQRDVAIGIVLMSMAPGVPFLSNSAGRAEGGSLSFALTISFLFTAISIVTIPITISLLAHVFPAVPIPVVPGRKFMTSLVAFQLVPLVLGILVRPYLGAPAADKAAKLLHYLFFAATLVFVVLIFPHAAGAIEKVIGHVQVFVIAGIGLFSMAAGWLLGGPDSRYRRTLSIATLMRNIGLCVTIGSGQEFADTLVVPAILVYTLVTLALSLPLRTLYKRVPRTATT